MTLERVSILGLGYVGLPTAAVFADAGIETQGVDVNADVVDSVNAGRPHFVEPDLEVLVRRTTQDGRLRAGVTPEPADAFIIAVPTPFKADRAPDLSYVEAAAHAVAPVLKVGDLVILESTAPVGATEMLAAWLAADRPDLTFPQQQGELSDIRVAHCPERVLPGKVLDEVVNNSRVIGGMTGRCAAAAAAVYKTVVRGECHVTNARTAELTKLVENAFRDVNIGFANELSLICDRLEIDVWELIRMANLHSRVNILRPGPGVGGHCIAVDPWFIVHTNPDDVRLIPAARAVNDDKPRWVVDKVVAQCAELGRRPAIACLGLAYKADIDDLRESPAVKIVSALAERDEGDLLVVEPHIDALPPALAALDLRLHDFSAALAAADVVLLLVDHKVFRQVDRGLLNGKVVVDTCGVW